MLSEIICDVLIKNLDYYPCDTGELGFSLFGFPGKVRVSGYIDREKQIGHFNIGLKLGEL